MESRVTLLRGDITALDVDALAAAIEAAIGPRHDELARAALARAESYSWDTAAQLIADTYRDIAGR